MEVYQGLEAIPSGTEPTYLALGMFDGVHRGHQAVLAETRAAATAAAGRDIVLTFDPHPQRVIAPPPEPILLTTVPERLELFAVHGMSAAVIVRFDEPLRQTPAERWVEELATVVTPGGVVVSSAYAFGRDRGGNVEVLRAGGARFGFSVTVTRPVHVAGTLISSTLIRRLIREGQVEEAGLFLGHPFAVRGEVVEGERRGRTLGFPTVNLSVHPDKILPARGIYAAWARLEGQVVAAAVSVGTRPTFGPGNVLVEAYLLDFEGNVYGEEIELVFEQRLRDELAFRTVPELVAQMEADVAHVRAILTPESPDRAPI